MWFLCFCLHFAKHKVTCVTNMKQKSPQSQMNVDSTSQPRTRFQRLNNMRAVVNVSSQIKSENSDDNISLPKVTPGPVGPVVQIKQYVFFCLYFVLLFVSYFK